MRKLTITKDVTSASQHQGTAKKKESLKTQCVNKKETCEGSHVEANNRFEEFSGRKWSKDSPVNVKEM